MRNRLFDSILRTCGADTDDIHSGEAEGNFWAENELFEAVLREAKNSSLPNLADNIDRVLQVIKNGTEEEKQQLSGIFFFIAETPQELINIGIKGEFFEVKYGVISRHHKKDPNHSLTAQNWKDLCNEIVRPFAISKYIDGFRFYTNVSVNNKPLAVGIDIKKIDKKLEVNTVSTAFGFDGDISKIPDLIYSIKNA